MVNAMRKVETSELPELPESPRSRAPKRGKLKISTFLSNRAGGSMMVFAFTLPILLGAAGLGYDAVIWYMTKRQIQTVADNAALSGVYALVRNENYTTAALTDAERNEFTNGLDGVVHVNVPPQYGKSKDQANAVEVIVDAPGLKLFSSQILGRDVTIQARSVAGMITTGGDHCILALDHEADAAVNFDGSAYADISCGVASNSRSETAILVDGNAYLNADPAQAFGGIVEKGSGDLDTAHPPQPYSQRLADPYAGTEWPTAAQLSEPCVPTNQGNGYRFRSSDSPIDPGIYCGDIDIQGTVVLNPGVYVLKGGDLNINSNADVSGQEITFVFMGDPVSQTGSINRINGGADLNLTAPGIGGHSSGPFEDQYAGMLIMQHPGAPGISGQNIIENRVLGNSSLVLRGALYFPNQNVTFSGGADEIFGCLQIVARTVTFTGNTSINNDQDLCVQTDVTPIAQQRVRVVE